MGSIYNDSELLKDLQNMAFKSRDSPEEETPDENASIQAAQAEKGVLADRCVSTMIGISNYALVGYLMILDYEYCKHTVLSLLRRRAP